MSGIAELMHSEHMAEFNMKRFDTQLTWEQYLDGNCTAVVLIVLLQYVVFVLLV